MKYQLRIVLAPYCGKLLFLAPMDSIAYMERVEIK